jgi:sugar phosphate permease
MKEKPLIWLLPITICSLVSLFYFYDFLIRVMPSAMTHELMQHFNISAKGLGIMLSLFYWGYTPLQIIAGLMFDRFSPRVLITISMSICALGTFLFGFSDSIFIVAVGRFLMGFFSAFAFVGPLVLAARWLPSKYFALYVGALQLLGCIGAIFGEKPVALLVHHINWQNTVLWIAISGIILAILFWLIIRDYPEEQHVEIKEHTSTHELKRLYIVLRNPQTWWVGLYAFAIWIPAEVFATLWGIPFLVAAYKISTSAAAQAVSLAWLGMGIVSVIGGWWSDYIGRRCLPLALSALLGLITIICVIYIHLPLLLLYILLFLFGAGITGQVISFGVIKDINPHHVVGTATGINNMFILLGGGIIFQPLVGVILHALWQGNMLNGTSIYSAASYQLALSIVPISFFVALIVSMFFIKETYCKSV